MSSTKESTIKTKTEQDLGDVIAAELNRTDLGHLINEYKNVVLAILILFVLGAFGFAGWKSWSANNHEKTRQHIVDFKTQYLKPWTEKKKEASDVFTAYEILVSQTSSASSLMELTPEAVNIARESNYEPLKWVNVFKTAQAKCAKTDFCFLHFSLAAATLLEDAGKFEDALNIQQSLIGNPFVIEDKLYFDLARLAVSANKMDLKNTYLEFLKKNHSSSNYTSLAQQL